MVSTGNTEEVLRDKARVIDWSGAAQTEPRSTDSLSPGKAEVTVAVS